MTAATLAGRCALSVVLPGVPESVRAARQMVRRSLGAGHPAAEAAALCVSELATNAVAYTRSGLPGGRFAVAVQSVPGGVLIRVRDGGARGLPALARRPPGEHGRGLRIVAALSEAWGAEPAGGPAGARAAGRAAAVSRRHRRRYGRDGSAGHKAAAGYDCSRLAVLAYRAAGVRSAARLGQSDRDGSLLAMAGLVTGQPEPLRWLRGHAGRVFAAFAACSSGSGKSGRRR